MCVDFLFNCADDRDEEYLLMWIQGCITKISNEKTQLKKLEDFTRRETRNSYGMLILLNVVYLVEAQSVYRRIYLIKIFKGVVDWIEVFNQHYSYILLAFACVRIVFT